MQPDRRDVPLEAGEDDGIRDAGGPGGGDVAFPATLLAVNLVPVLGELVRPGRWGPGTVGFATACALLAAGELWRQARARARG